MGLFSLIKHNKGFSVTKDDASNTFAKYWQIMVVMLTMAVGYGSNMRGMDALADNVESLAEDVKEQQGELKSSATDRGDVKLSVALAQRDISSIDQRLERLEKQGQKDKQEILDAIKAR